MAVAADPALVRNEVPTPRSSPAATARKTPVVEANWGTGWNCSAPFEKHCWKIADEIERYRYRKCIYIIYIYMYLYIESIWKYDAYVFILGKFFYHSVRWRH